MLVNPPTSNVLSIKGTSFMRYSPLIVDSQKKDVLFIMEGIFLWEKLEKLILKKLGRKLLI